MRKVAIYDTTLRDGAQGENISFTAQEKMEIAELLDKRGVHYIEGGWPGANLVDTEFFEMMKERPLRNAKLCAFGSTRKKGVRVEDDCTLKALIGSGAEVVTIFGKSWDLHVLGIMDNTLEENLSMIHDSVLFLKMHGREVVYDAEHFFDGYMSDPVYAIQTLKVALAAGADYLVLCDTNGGTMLHEIFEILIAVFSEFDGDVKFGIHAHNDCEMAVANTIEAVRAGIDMVQGTINGYGERCGNANLSSIIPILCLKLGIDVMDSENLSKLKSLSVCVAEIAGMRPRRNQAFVGKSAFAHKGGIHASAVAVNPEGYEHVYPELVGNARRNLISLQSGRTNIRMKLAEYGIEASEEEITMILDNVKARESEGFSFELAEASLEVLIRNLLDEVRQFEVVSWMADSEYIKNGVHDSSASVCIEVDKVLFEESTIGDGPVEALDLALKSVLMKKFSKISRARLVDYKVKVINGSDGTASKVSVLTRFQSGDMLWTTVGVSRDIVLASEMALSDAYAYFLANV